MGVTEEVSAFYRLEQSATVPSEPIKPKRALIIALGLILGGMIGVFIGLIRLSYDYERAGLLRSLVPCVAWTVIKGFLVMKIPVTGGAGFIGSAVIRHIIGSTADPVVNLDKLTSSKDQDGSTFALCEYYV